MQWVFECLVGFRSSMLSLSMMKGKASELPAGTTRHTGYVTMPDGVRTGERDSPPNPKVPTHK